MRCPYCSHEATQVKDSRPTEDNSAIRRRRVCEGCGGRFTTFERVQLRDMTVVKSTGVKEPFDREKLFYALKNALQKRAAEEKIERVVNSIVRRLETSGEAEISSQFIGRMCLDALRQIDLVAYIRYASIYKDFRDLDDFETFFGKIRQDQGEESPSLPF
ncbi:MAG TPA: transcriptional regulator NrdR [Rhodospirillaceae bacterium]|nr:MAG: transcriptional regulator NrdR [Alphaproteobacteria bacterium GWF2_58_20]HAU28895.1 transcriptional regulator NrdR [Rhodospirillaceae bacterium]